MYYIYPEKPNVIKDFEKRSERFISLFSWKNSKKSETAIDSVFVEATVCRWWP